MLIMKNIFFWIFRIKIYMEKIIFFKKNPKNSPNGIELFELGRMLLNIII